MINPLLKIMSKVYFAGDLHFAHKNIAGFRPNIDGIDIHNEEEHRELIIQRFNKIVTKRDTLYLMGDICFDEEFTGHVGRLNGYKKLILGNHDHLNLPIWSQYVVKIGALDRYKKHWISHAPIHPAELRGKGNIHGHVHYATIEDARYFNCSLENINYEPIEFSVLLEREEKQKEMWKT